MTAGLVFFQGLLILLFCEYSLSISTDPGLCRTRHHKTLGTRGALWGRTHRTVKGRSCHTDTRTDKTDREAPRAPLGGRRSPAHANAEPRPPLPTRNARTPTSPGRRRPSTPRAPEPPPLPEGPRSSGSGPAPPGSGPGAVTQSVRGGTARGGPGGRGTRNYGINYGITEARRLLGQERALRAQIQPVAEHGRVS